MAEEVSEKQPLQGKFVHLHTHTHYSLLDGLSKVPELIARTKELGMDALAITDHGTMYGVIEFYKEAKKQGIKPIIGMEGYISPRRMTDKVAKTDGTYYHLVMLAKNETGYKNLVYLTTQGHLEGYYYKPRVDKELLRELSDGLIALSGCMQGEVAQHLVKGNYEGAKKTAYEYQDIFGAGNFYLEIQDHAGWKEGEKLNEDLIKLSRDTGIPLVLTRDSHYIHESDLEVHDVLLCVQTGKTVSEIDRMKIEFNLHLTTPEETMERFAHVPEAVENTVKIAGHCNVELDLGNMLIPPFEVPNGETPTSYLEKLCREGAIKRYGKREEGMSEEEAFQTVPAEVTERLTYELEVIERMGFQSYFLIIQDFVRWAKQNMIFVGPGRGSAAGSIVAYVLEITELDPLRYGLLFERFLNPDRISMPDIDIDFADDRRDEVIEYVAKKYGQESVAHIITFGTMMARNAVRDVGRALGMSYGEVDTVAKLIPPNKPLAESRETVLELKAMAEEDAQIDRLLFLASKLEGVIRHASTHASGIVIAEGTLTEHVPLQKPIRGSGFVNQTQFAMGPIEDIGLLKMDFLGLANLTIIRTALDIILKTTGIDVSLRKIPLDDEKTFKLLASGETTGIFQLESAGMRRHIKELKPTTIEDIIAMVALYRPGPMQFIESFINRKHGREEIVYAHPLLENALKNTYGIPVYQEQVMQVSKDMAGFSGGEADTLRKAMGKKIAKLMAEMREKFIEGSIQNGVDKKIATQIFDQFEEFAAYGFNKSHAACYALIAYQTAYLKANYPPQFMAALMTSDYNDTERIAMEVEECKRMGLEVLPPDIKESFSEFTVVPGAKTIRFGLTAIKNVGTGVIEAVVRTREEGGRFQSIEDFARRVPALELNKKVMESLIRCGAFDSLGERGQLLRNMEKILEYGSRVQRSDLGGQTDIFGMLGEESAPPLALEAANAVESAEKLRWEKELLGLYISEHPLDRYGNVLAGLKPIGSLVPVDEGKDVIVGGVITGIKKITTRGGENMLFVTLQDKTGQVELLVFPSLLKKTQSLWQAEHAVLKIKAKVNTKDREGKVTSEIKLLVNEAAAITEEMNAALPPPSKAPEQLTIELGETAAQETFQQVRELLLGASGSTPVVVSFVRAGKRTLVRLPMQVTVSDELLKQIARVVGEGSAAVSEVLN